MKQIDRIRSMNAEELAEWINENVACMRCCVGCGADLSCVEARKAWLESEVTDE